jgi:hypothetical protein
MKLPSYVGFASAKPLHTVILGALVFAILGAALASAAPLRQEVAIDFIVDQRARQATTDYAYDGYYALRAAELFADTLISWFSTPSFVKAVHERANRPLDEFMPLPTRMFRAKKYSGQNVVVRFIDPESSGDSGLAEAIIAEASARTASMNPDADGGPTFEVTAAEPVRSPANMPPLRGGLAGAFVGAFFGLALAYVARAKKDPQP